MKSVLLVIVLLGSIVRAGDVATTAARILRQHPEARVVEGRDGWMFLANELRHVAKGTDWVAPETPPDPPHADPEPALLALQQQLTELGIELVLVPVPAKAVIYADKLPGKDAGVSATGSPSGLRVFMDRMREQGLSVVDLETRFAAARQTEQLYCQTDSHWSPYGSQLAAETVAAILRQQTWYQDTASVEIKRSDPAMLTIHGDLAETAGAGETIAWRRVMRAGNESPVEEGGGVLVLGDSHTLVFSSGGDMHAEDGGFVEYLAYALQLPVERIANRGSASTPPRISLFRKASAQPEWLEGIRAVVYCFTARELTESLNGWRIVPVSPRFR